MGVLTIPLGMGVPDNPLKLSPFVNVPEYPDLTPAGPEYNLMTESGLFIITEDDVFLTTE